ncbi:unnamed protein product [Prorocentrum cordatum]|uniref:Branchpoint-bridging protein n=1 Tax=Prorocentrum cordatum TaxID=2364126 RepID=A0ABN9Y3H2_9DINO|nr:unnamed protein product [Polarella glacialis]
MLPERRERKATTASDSVPRPPSGLRATGPCRTPSFSPPRCRTGRGRCAAPRPRRSARLGRPLCPGSRPSWARPCRARTQTSGALPSRASMAQRVAGKIKDEDKYVILWHPPIHGHPHAGLLGRGGRRIREADRGPAPLEAPRGPDRRRGGPAGAGHGGQGERLLADQLDTLVATANTDMSAEEERPKGSPRKARSPGSGEQPRAEAAKRKIAAEAEALGYLRHKLKLSVDGAVQYQELSAFGNLPNATFLANVPLARVTVGIGGSAPSLLQQGTSGQSAATHMEAAAAAGSPEAADAGEPAGGEAVPQRAGGRAPPAGHSLRARRPSRFGLEPPEEGEGQAAAFFKRAVAAHLATAQGTA